MSAQDASGLLFRPAGPDDADAIAGLHADSWRRHYRGAYSDAYLDGDVLTDRRAVWSERLAKPRPSATILATDEEQLAGFVHVVFDDHERWGALVDNLHVAAPWQRRGLGSALLGRAAQAVSTEGGGTAIYLWVLEQNLAAQAFYSALGGDCVERAKVGPPGGVPERLTGSPVGLRCVWRDCDTLTTAWHSLSR